MSKRKEANYAENLTLFDFGPEELEAEAHSAEEAKEKEAAAKKETKKETEKSEEKPVEMPAKSVKKSGETKPKKDEPAPAPKPKAPKAVKKTAAEKPKRRKRYAKLIGYFDGASRGNPGEAGTGSALFDEAGNLVWQKAGYLGKATNNEAEYTALIYLLTEAKARKVKELEIFGDSQLVVSQVTKEWKITKVHLMELAKQVWALTAGINVIYKWVPREQNKLADALSNEGIDQHA